jgi:predicted O-linked N-acetylglucosamine transferase (SPINDLY family)
MVNVAEALSQGTRHQQAGRLAEAEQLYRQVLACEPNNVDALHLMGLLAMQSGQFEPAIELINRAIRLDRSQAAFYANLGEANRHLKRHVEAIENYRKALKLQPDLGNVHSLLGLLLRNEGKLDESVSVLREALRLRPEDNLARIRLGQALQDQNKLSEAEACFRRVLRSDPHAVEAQFSLGSVLQTQGKLDEATACYRAALALKPDYADAHINLGTILQQQSIYDEAAEHFQAAVQLNPGFATAHMNLGTNFQARGQLAEAIGCYRRALELEPGNPLALNALGSALVRQGRSDDALASFEEALRADPGSALAHLNIGGVYQVQGKMGQAVTALERVLELDPSNAPAYTNLGMIRNEQGRRDEAIAACHRAIELAPESPQAYNNLAIALSALGLLEEGIGWARKACTLSPIDSPHHSNLLYMLNFHPGYNAAALFAEHRAWAQRYADSLTDSSAGHDNDRTPGRRLRVGYVSAHFFCHAVNFFSEPILRAHDHDQFEVFCYAHVDCPDETTGRLRGYADQWRDIAHLSDAEAAALVRRDRIDILVDLTGHIGGNRMLLFARKPAPIQVTYIGYQNTTGMKAMDYRLTDDWADPPGTTEQYYTETLVRLPRSFFCYLPSSDAPAIGPLPMVDNGFVTFGSFNAYSKVTTQVLATWARLLHAVPRSRLVILANAAPSLIERIAAFFEGAGIGADRLTIADRRPRNRYLELIDRTDIALDPFPFNGHTTTCDALWQGVPVVALAGQTYASRFGSSAHVNLGLRELVSTSPDEYVEIAARLAGDVDKLAHLRFTLRDRMASSALLDFAGFARNLEAAYRQMWTTWLIEHPA